MPIETFRTLIARNKRNSVLLIAAFMAFFVLLGLLIGNVWGGGDGGFAIAVAVGAGIIAFFLSLATYFGGGSVLMSVSQARPITHADDPQLYNVVEEMCIAGGVPVPQVYLIDDTAMNAFAAGRGPGHAMLAVTTGLRSKLTRDELQGVIAHELSHVRHYDVLFATLIAVMVGVLVMLCDVFLRSVAWGGAGRRRSSDRERGGGGAQIILVVLALLLAIIAPILAKIIEMALSRQREFMADAGSVELTRNPQGLASALAKLSDDPEVLEVANRATAGLYIVHPIKKFEDRAGSIFDSHPPIKDRIQRILSLTV